MVWVPSANPLVVKVVVAALPLPLSVPCPMLIEGLLPRISRKVTVPVGVLPVLPVTVAVNVTGAPNTDDGLEDVTVVVVVGVLVTVCITVPALAKKLLSPA